MPVAFGSRVISVGPTSSILRACTCCVLPFLRSLVEGWAMNKLSIAAFSASSKEINSSVRPSSRNMLLIWSSDKSLVSAGRSTRWIPSPGCRPTSVQNLATASFHSLKAASLS
eukprot:3975005-Prorocentrum_lima.AAC.1